MVNRFASIAFFFLCALTTFAQSHFSPYSYYGIGEVGSVDNATFAGLGNNTFNTISGSKLNTFNPASYSFIKPQLPLFGLSLSSRLSSFEQGGQTEKSGYTNISEMAFGISFAKRFGLGVGLKPFSRRGYGFTEYHTIDDEIFIYEYNGEGSLNQAFGGISVAPIKTNSISWSVGAQFNSIFGSLLNERKAYLEGSSEAGIEYRTMRLKTLMYEFGTVISDTIKPGHYLTLSATYRPSQDFNAFTNTQLYSANNSTETVNGGLMGVDNPANYTFISETGEIKRKLVYASKIGLGFDYTYAPNSRKDSTEYQHDFQWKFVGGFTMTDWSQVGFRDESTDVPFYTNKTSAYHFGVQFTPETKILDGNPTKFFNRMDYRIGFYQKTLPYAYNGVGLSEFGTTFGFGIPILFERTESSLQFGCVLGSRGTNQAGSLNEKFVGINFGILIAPSKFDKWFIKRKLD